jgi:hypothetical protein
VLADHDFHPDEPTVRIFCTPSRGVLRLDDSVAVSEAVYDGTVLRHYAFAGHWFKVNVTTDLSGRLTETGDPGRRFAVNCDIATPMEREACSTFGVDLFTDVLVRNDATSYVVADRDELGGDAGPRCYLGGGRPRRRARAPGIARAHRGGMAAGVAWRTRPVRAVPASPGTADAARPGTRPPAVGNPPDLVTRVVPGQCLVAAAEFISRRSR